MTEYVDSLKPEPINIEAVLPFKHVRRVGQEYFAARELCRGIFHESVKDREVVLALVEIEHIAAHL